MRKSLLVLLIFLPWLQPAIAQTSPLVQLTLDTSEAEQALHILDEQAAHQAITSANWQLLFATLPYRRLKDREAAMGRAFTDDSFQRFLLQPETLGRRTEWHTALANMKKANLAALGTAVLTWLPTGATLQTQIFPEIKPLHNSFVWAEPGNSPAIFLYLEKQSQDEFENTVAHECHHIGLASLEKQQSAIEAGLPPNVRKAMEWLSGFGEGEAMLAAAGSSDRHPHWEDDAMARARWDADMMHFNADLQAIQQLLLDILDGKLTSDADIQKRAAPFWGDAQGAWYTVGYEMAALVEKQYGRSTLNQCLLDPRKLLFLYNKIANQANTQGASLATWSPHLLSKLNDQP